MTMYRDTCTIVAVAVGAVGVAAARPYSYAPPACGYYPYPPCY
jgi:hypothetical protein